MLLTELQTYSLSHLANAPFSSASSTDNSFSFISERGIDILELSPDPKSVSPSLSFRRYVIKLPTDIPTSQLGINPSDLLPHLDKTEAYALITDTTVSPKLTRTLTPIPAPHMALWSPVGIFLNHRCVLAVLTDVGSLCLHVLANHKYMDVASVSTLWLEHCRTFWNPPPRNTMDKLQELKERAETVKLTAMCWLQQVLDGAGWLAAVSKNGLISLWQVKAVGSPGTSVDVTFVSQFHSELSIVTVLHWNVLNSNQSLLTAASLDGRIRCFNVSTITDEVVKNFQNLWTEKDRIATTHMDSWPWQDGTILIASKGAFLIALYLNDQGEQISYAAYRCCDTSVNGLTKLSNSEVLLVTRSSRFTRLTLLLGDDGKIKLSTDKVESYINISHMGCYGLTMTQNCVICFILLSVNQSYDHLRLREPTQVVVCSVGGNVEPQAVLQDPQRPISQLWDCLELLRVQILQKVLVADLSYPRSVLDNMTIDQLTSTLWWATFASAAEDDEAKHQALVKLRCELETLVVSCHFFKRTAVLLSSSPDTLSPFQLHSLGLLRKWLIHLQSLPEEYSTTLITGRTLLQQLKTLESNLPSQELCAICGTVVSDQPELFYSDCQQGHRLPRCSLSLVQCSQLPYYVCAQCGALAHPCAVEVCGVSCNLCGGVLRIDEEIL